MSSSASGMTIGDRLAAMNEAFLPSAPVHRQELLSGRQGQLFSLLETSQTPGGHAAIFGERGVGKTSVAAVFETDLRGRGVRAVRINCSAASTFQSLVSDVLTEWLSDSPEPAAEEYLPPLLSSHLTQADIVRALAAVSRDVKSVILFDEFDVVADANVGEDFANLMKALSDKRVDTHLVVVGVAEDVNAILKGHASVARGLNQVPMPRLGAHELSAVLRNGFGALAIDLPAELERRVILLSQGLAHYTHLLGKELARRAILAERDLVLADDWNHALSGALSKAEQQIIDLYGDATTTAKPSMFPDLLLACALAKKDQQGFFRPADVHGPLNDLSGKSYAMAAFTGNLASLASSDRGPALQQREFADRRKRYRFANPLLQPYVLLKAVSTGVLSYADIEDDDIWS